MEEQLARRHHRHQPHRKIMRGRHFLTMLLLRCQWDQVRWIIIMMITTMPTNQQIPCLQSLHQDYSLYHRNSRHSRRYRKSHMTTTGYRIAMEMMVLLSLHRLPLPTLQSSALAVTQWMSHRKSMPTLASVLQVLILVASPWDSAPFPQLSRSSPTIQRSERTVSDPSTRSTSTTRSLHLLASTMRTTMTELTTTRTLIATRCRTLSRSPAVL